MTEQELAEAIGAQHEATRILQEIEKLKLSPEVMKQILTIFRH